MIILKDGVLFAGTRQLNVGKIKSLLAEGVWTKADLDEWGLDAATEFVVPPGKLKTGAARYVEGDPWWAEEYDVVDVPPPSAEDVRQASFTVETDVIDIVNRLKTATPAQINSWIDTNVTNIATARNVLKAIVKLLVRLL